MRISVSKFSYFLVQVLCFTNEEIEAQGLGGLSDFFQEHPDIWSSVFYLILHCHHWF